MLNGSTNEVTETRLFAKSGKHATFQSFQTPTQMSVLEKVSIHRPRHLKEQAI